VHADCHDYDSQHADKPQEIRDKKVGKNEMDINSHSNFDGASVSILHSASDYADACSRFDGDASGEYAKPRISLLRATRQQTGDPYGSRR
jgi:hypothetical protein